MKMPQIAFSLELFVVDLLKKASKKNKVSLSEYLRQNALEGLLKEYPNLIAFRHPLSGKITKILNEKESKEFREKIKEAEDDTISGHTYTINNIDNFWQGINSAD
jgi:hypothetical protein